MCSRTYTDTHRHTHINTPIVGPHNAPQRAYEGHLYTTTMIHLTVRVCVRVYCLCVCVCVCVCQGPNGRVLDQYEQDFYYKTDTFIIEPTEMTVFMYLTTALRNVLRQLAAIQTDSPRHALFELYRWVWTPELVAVFVEEAAALPPRLKFQIDINELSDTVLATMLPLAARASRLTTREVAMKSDDHAQVPWPWEMLQVTPA